MQHTPGIFLLPAVFEALVGLPTVRNQCHLQWLAPGTRTAHSWAGICP